VGLAQKLIHSHDASIDRGRVSHPREIGRQKPSRQREQGRWNFDINRICGFEMVRRLNVTGRCTGMLPGF
jgi:hypothetical protein